MIKLKGVKETLASLKKQLEEEKEKRKNEEKQKILENLKAATPVDTGEAQEGWYANANSIENDVEHIDVLNSGSSQQAPAYFIERTVLKNPHVKVQGNIIREK